MHNLKVIVECKQFDILRVKLSEINKINTLLKINKINTNDLTC